MLVVATSTSFRLSAFAADFRLKTLFSLSLSSMASLFCIFKRQILRNASFELNIALRNKKATAFYFYFVIYAKKRKKYWKRFTGI